MEKDEIRNSLVATEKRVVELFQQNRIEKREDVAVYGVDGFSGNSYFVIAQDDMPMACTCPAGQFGMTKCYHREGVLYMLQVLALEPNEEEFGF